jgi:hypothetical protein
VYGIVPSSNLNKIASRALNDTSADDEEDTNSSSIAFIDVDGARRDGLSKQKSMRRRNLQLHSQEQDTAALLEKYKQQLSVQEKTLAENTLELEHKLYEVDSLRAQLTTTKHDYDRLQEALEEMARTNRLLQAKLEQQILKQNVSKLLNDRRMTVIARADSAASTAQPLESIAGMSSRSEAVDRHDLMRAAFFEEVEDKKSNDLPIENSKPPVAIDVSNDLVAKNPAATIHQDSLLLSQRVDAIETPARNPQESAAMNPATISAKGNASKTAKVNCGVM